MDKEKLFNEFLEAYFENVKRELPESYRARQLEMGGILADKVYEFETRFLKEPFMDVIKKIMNEKNANHR